MRRIGWSTPKASLSATMSFSWVADSASLRDKACCALRMAASTRSFFSPRRGGPMEVELRQKRVEHLLTRQSPVGARKIGAVAPVLIGAEEEDFDTELPCLVGDREHVGFGDRARIDALLTLNRGKRANAIAEPRRAFEVERRGGLVHRMAKAALDRAAAAGKEIARFSHQVRIVVEPDFPGARRRAPLDLVEQAWPGAIGVKTIRAGAQEKRAL